MYACHTSQCASTLHGTSRTQLLQALQEHRSRLNVAPHCNVNVYCSSLQEQEKVQRESAAQLKLLNIYQSTLLEYSLRESSVKYLKYNVLS